MDDPYASFSSVTSGPDPYAAFSSPVGGSDPVRPVNKELLKAQLRELTVDPKALAAAKARQAASDQARLVGENVSRAGAAKAGTRGKGVVPIALPEAQHYNDMDNAGLQGATFGFADEIGALGNAIRTGVRNVTGRGDGFTAGDAYKASMAQQAERRARYESEHPVENLAYNLAGGAANPANYVGGDVITGARTIGGGALRAAAVGGVTGALYGAGSGEGVKGRTREAVEQGVLSAVLSGGMHLGGEAIQAGSNAAQRAKVARANANPLPEIVDTFDRAQIDPSLAAAGEGKARLTKAIGENPVVGGQVRARAVGALEQAQASAENNASAFGSATGSHGAGDVVQGGVKDFNERFSDRAGKLYDNAFDAIDKGQQKALQASQRAAALKTGLGASSVTPAPTIVPTATQAVLGDISGSVNAGGLAKVIQDPRLSTIAQALENGGSDIRFGDLRALRTWAREAQSNETLRQGISQANLQRLEGSLTQDISQNAERLAGPEAARRLQQADQFYRLGSQRIQTQLQRFVGNSANPVAPERAYEQVWAAAKEGGTANVDRLSALKKSLRPQEWGDVAASTVQRMGKAKPGVEGDFSVSTFATNYKSLSPSAKDLLFGSGERRNSLEALASASERLRSIEKMANHSNSASAGQAVGTFGGLGGALTALFFGHPAPAVAAGAGLGAMRVSGDLLTNPAFARWLAKGVRAARGSPGVQKAWVADLAKAAAKDPKLEPLYAELRAQITQPRGRPTQAPDPSQGQTDAPP